MIRAALALALMVAPAAAQESVRCGNRAVFLADLAAKYGEEIVAQGQVDDKMLMEMTANRTKGNWTILYTGADGAACIVAFGKGLEVLAPEPSDVPG